MLSTRFSPSTRSLFRCFGVLCITAAVLFFISSSVGSGRVAAQDDTPIPETPEAVFPGTGTGAIPDSPAGGPTCGDYTAAPLNISFAVTGMSAPLNDVRVNMTLTHTWVGDLKVTLLSPGSTASKVIYQQT